MHCSILAHRGSWFECERILAQKEPERLERWLEKAIIAESIAEVLDEPS